MRTVVWLLVLAVAAAVAAMVLGRNDGLVSFFWGNWRVDLSLNLFLLLQVGLCAALMVALKGLGSLMTLPRRAAAWRRGRREQAAHAALREALAESFSARFARSVKAAQRAVMLGEQGFGDREALTLAHLVAASGLHKLQDSRRRDAQLDALFKQLHRHNSPRRSREGAFLLAAEWALDDGHPARAIELLSALPAGAARRTQALRLRLRAARAAGHPVEALHMARLLASHQAFSPEVARGLLRSLASEAVGSAHDIDQLSRVWRQLDDADRRDAQVTARGAQRAAALGDAALGRTWLQPMWQRLDRLQRHERDAVALALADAAAGLEAEWLPTLEGAQVRYAREAAVVLAVGTAFAERSLWGKARPLLEQAADAPELPSLSRRRAWRRLAMMATADGDGARARQCEQAAAAVES